MIRGERLAVLKGVWSKIMAFGLMRPLSPPARVLFAVVQATLLAAAFVLYLVDFFTYTRSTAGLVFLFAFVYGATAYGMIFAVDFAVRGMRRRLRG